MGSAGALSAASAATPPTLDLKVLLIGDGSNDVTTAAWEAALSNEGVPYTEVTAAGSLGSETVTLPTLSSGTTGNFNAVVFADDPADFASGQLTALYTYESTFQVRQVDGYAYPYPTLGQTYVGSGVLDGTTGTLTAAGLAAFPELKGPIPFDTGTYGSWSTVTAGAPFTPFLTNAAGDVLAGVYQHPATDPQAGVSELALFFDYNSSQLQWLLLSPGLINWVTQNTHLGLYRNYFGQDIDDNFLADNQWSSQYQCTPAATDPVDYTCPPAQQGVSPGTNGAPPDAQMSAADVAYVAAWEQQTGIKLNLLFNGIGACTADTAADESGAVCNGSVTDKVGTFTDPGQVVDSSYPNDAGLVNALLADKADFNWETHTWSHLFLGCVVWAQQALTSATANASGGSFTAGPYSYEITAATAYGESEPSAVQTVTVAANGSVTLTWPEAVNGTGTSGNAGPTLAQEEANHTGGTGFWGYNIYRATSPTGTFGLVGQVAENPSATSSTTYTFTDTGTAAGAAPDSSTTYPTATNPGIDCSNAAGSWLPASSTAADDSIDAEVGLDQAFAAANNLPNYTPAALVTGEHSGIENPNMPGALTDTGVTTIGTDASRQPQVYTIGPATTAPRYPSNIYYNAANWPDELNEYNTLYVATGDNLGDSRYPSETGRCGDTSSTTCRTTAAAEADLLASESHIMLSHVLDNNPRVGYAHQTNLIGPATQTVNGVTSDYGYTILTLINDMLSQYDSWYNTNSPLAQMTDVSEAQVLAEQSAWATAESGGNYTASETNGVVTVTNNGTAVNVPITVPSGTTVAGAAFGQAYGGDLSDWVNLGTAATETLTEDVVPYPWTDSDVGSPAVPGSASYSNGVFTVNGGGVDIWGGTDQFNYVSQSLTGDGSIVARVTSQSDTDAWAKAGVMIKQSTASGTSYALLGVTPGNGITFQYGFNASTSGGSYSFPNGWLKLTRTGSTITAFSSADGTTWTQVGVTTMSLTNPVTIGLFNCAHTASALNTATFDNVSVTAGTPSLPAPWADADVGSPAVPGSASYSNGVFTVNGGGVDIWGGTDQFNYVSQSLTGDGSIVARVTSQSDTDAWAKAGVMIKQSTASGTSYALLGVTPGNGITFQYGFNASTSGGSYSFPNGWLKLTRTGSTITAFSSADGTTWTQVGVTTMSLTDPVAIGLFNCAHTAGALNTATFDNVSVTGSSPLPSPWADSDVGSPALAGSASYTNGVFTVDGGGADIWGSSDQFNYVSQSLTGDGSIVARVTSQSDTDPWAKAGVMIKQSTTTGSPYALLAVTPGYGVHFEYGYNTDVGGESYTFPNGWLKLTRTGSTITAYSSADGSSWTPVGATTISLTDPVTIGLFTTAHNAGALSTATFDNVSVTAGGSSALPSPWADADVGSPAVPGSASYASGVFTVNGSGADIWGGTDQFNYVSQPLTGDGTIVARVTSQSDTDPWAKAGVMIKQSTTGGSSYALLGVTPGNGITFQYGFNASTSGGSYSFPNGWVKLTLSGSTITAYSSADGTTWTEVGTTTISLTDPVTIGLFTCAHNAGALSTATFDNVSVTSPLQ